jgi:hypothetical protein
MLPCCKGNNNCEVKKVNEVKEVIYGELVEPKDDTFGM